MRTGAFTRRWSGGCVGGCWRSIPSTAFQPPHVERTEAEVLTPEEAKRLMAVLRGSEFEVPILMGLFCGLRPTEYLALRWQDVDLERRELRVRQERPHLCEGGPRHRAHGRKRPGLSVRATEDTSIETARDDAGGVGDRIARLEVRTGCGASSGERMGRAGPGVHRCGPAAPQDPASRARVCGGPPQSGHRGRRPALRPAAHDGESAPVPGREPQAGRQPPRSRERDPRPTTYGHLLPGQDRAAADRLSGLLEDGTRLAHGEDKETAG